MNCWYIVFLWEGKWHYSNWKNVKCCFLLPVREMEGGNNQVTRLYSWLVGSEAWLTGCITISYQGARPNVQLPWVVKLALHTHRTVLQLWQFLQTASNTTLLVRINWPGLIPTLNLCFLFQYSFILKWEITWCSTGPCLQVCNQLSFPVAPLDLPRSQAKCGGGDELEQKYSVLIWMPSFN